MELEPPEVHPKGTWSGSAFWTRFKPTPPSIYSVSEWCDTQKVPGHLPQVFHHQQALKRGLSTEGTELVLGL
eukprot:2172834-Alexandrium_andersonii.AAC.1